MEADVLACVDGVSVTSEALIAARVQYGPGVETRRVLEALIDAELLAAEAARRGLWSNWLIEPLKAAMVRAWLERRFETAHAADKVAAKDIGHAFNSVGIRIRYRRKASYFVTEAQLLCCSGDWRQCKVNVDTQRCIDEHASSARSIHEMLVADPPQSSLEMSARIVLLAGRFPDIAAADVKFYYDKSKPHDQQGNYDTMVEPYSRAVVQLEPGQISSPIRTSFGWHIARLNKMEPARSSKPSDPEVRDEIARNILPLLRRRDLIKQVVGLMRTRGVQIHFDRLGKSP